MLNKNVGSFCPLYFLFKIPVETTLFQVFVQEFDK